ncbi:hypothetical protein BZG35_06685 [Brevundimonas sp. LM2]|uniref:DUF2793 domain-containing protein n=1 Tax=Brevundimonas sp. LM2 TaxID=1938605 RepID=UPI000983C590|nr:DUF2793 domain-containing protein [Brevundimonas sp. LM2]AQR61373.1 hypothetical protein BZG35_06685 [Brevundimonas sp. LM2]
MATSQSARLGLPYVAAGQLQKHVTVNEALTRLDGLIQAAVVSRTVAVQPTDAADGDLYILPPGANGSDWSDGSDGDLVRAEFGGWTRVAVPPGMVVVVQDEGQLVVRTGATWSAPTLSGGAVQNLARLGLNATADAGNPLTARINSALLTARPAAEGGTGALRLVLNKDAAGDVVSLLFQRGYSGRAELGLIGDDALSLKVSSDGSTWREALRVEPDDGRVVLPGGALRTEAVLLTGSTPYAPPTWARMLTITAVGGGGGGGNGGFAASGDRAGGGGGGGGGLSIGRWSTADLPAGLTVVVGAGGAAGAAGQVSGVSAAGLDLLTARGGGAGAAGASGGAGGAAGLGLIPANAGGASATAGPASAGQGLSGPGNAGGGGGGLSAAGTMRPAGAGGDGSTLLTLATGGTASSGVGAAGGSAATPRRALGGGGGAGGAASASGSGHAGGSGGAFGGGGGGGGAGVTAGGPGGAGGAGVVLILAEG